MTSLTSRKARLRHRRPETRRRLAPLLPVDVDPPRSRDCRADRQGHVPASCHRASPQARRVDSDACRPVRLVVPLRKLGLTAQRQPSEESLYLNTVCKPLRLLDERYADEAAAELNDSLRPLDAPLGKFTKDGCVAHLRRAGADDDTTSSKVRIDGHPRVNGLLDTIAAARPHGVPYPREFDDPETDRLLETATIYEWSSALLSDAAAS